MDCSRILGLSVIELQLNLRKWVVSSIHQPTHWPWGHLETFIAMDPFYFSVVFFGGGWLLFGPEEGPTGIPIPLHHSGLSMQAEAAHLHTLTETALLSVCSVSGGGTFKFTMMLGFFFVVKSYHPPTWVCLERQQYPCYFFFLYEAFVRCSFHILAWLPCFHLTLTQ